MKFWGAIGASIMGVVGFLALMLGAKQAGRDAAEADQMEGTLDAIKQRDDLDRELDDPVARRKLREKHQRD